MPRRVAELAAPQTPVSWLRHATRCARRQKARTWLTLGGLMPALRTVSFLVSLIALFAAPAAFAENFDYDSRRPAELRACDEQRDHGKVNEAKGCYQKLVNSSKDRATQAEAA